MSSYPLSLPDFALETYFSRWEFAAEHNLTASDAESMTLSELLGLGTESDRDSFDQLFLDYTPTWGTPSLREAVAATYASTDAADVLGFAGAGEAMFWAMQLFTEPGDHVIVTVPNYQSMESVPVASGVEVDGLDLWTGTGSDLTWTLDLDRFEAMLRPTTRVVGVNFPNNPTGFVPDAETWMAFNLLCHERGIRVISDEVYRGIEIDPSATLSPAVDVNPTALSVNVMSKAYGLPGLRVGWIASHDRAAIARLERAKHYTSICNAGPSEFLAAIALRNTDRIFERNRQIVTSNDRLAAERLGGCADLFEYSSPVGGCVCFPRYLGADGVEAFCRRAVEQRGVFLLPASIYRSEFGDVPPDRFRIGLGRHDFPTALDALIDHLREC